MYDIEVGVVGRGRGSSLSWSRMKCGRMVGWGQSAIRGEVEEGRGRVCGREIGGGGWWRCECVGVE